MVPPAVALVFASVACTGSGFRRTRMGGSERCPGAVALNSRNDCIGEGTETIVPTHCCNMLLLCKKLSGDCSQQYSVFIESLAQSCELQASDVAASGGGTYEIRDSTRVCSFESQAFLESQNQTRSDLFEACSPTRGKCPGHARSSKLEEKIAFVTAVYDSWSTCTTTTTTTTSAGLDLTEYFNSTGAGKTGVLFPDGEEYRCCCRPDAGRRSVACELKAVFKLPLGLPFWSGCGAEAGWDYHSWDNVFNKTGSGEPRAEFQGLENAGRCVVGGGDGALPEGLRGRWSPGELEGWLRLMALGPRPLVVNRAEMPLAVYLERRGSPFSMQVLQPGEAAVMHRPGAGPDQPYSVVALVGDEASLPGAGAVNPGSVALVAGLCATVLSAGALSHVSLPLVPVISTLVKSAETLGVGLLAAGGAHHFAESLIKAEPKAFKAEAKDMSPGIRYLEVVGGPSRAGTADLQIRDISLETYMGYNVRAEKRALSSRPNTTTIAFTIESCGDGRLLGAWTQAGLHSGRPRYVRAMDEHAVMEWSSTRKTWRIF